MVENIRSGVEVETGNIAIISKETIYLENIQDEIQCMLQ